MGAMRGGAGRGVIVRIERGIRREEKSEPKPVEKKPEDFGEWLTARSPYWKWDARHHVLLAQKLEALRTQENGRLMIFMPPRHGKSEMATIRFGAYLLERNPALRIIL